MVINQNYIKPNALTALNKPWVTETETKPNLFDFNNVKPTPSLNFWEPVSREWTTNFTPPIPQPLVRNPQPTQKETPSFLDDLIYDVLEWHTIDEIAKVYPELNRDTKLIWELHFDISNGITKDEINQLYPELSKDTLANNAITRWINDVGNRLMFWVWQAWAWYLNLVSKAWTWLWNLITWEDAKPTQFENPYTAIEREWIFWVEWTWETQNLQETNVWQDLLQYWAWLTSTAQTVYFPIINTVFSTAWQTDTWKKILENEFAWPIIWATIWALSNNWVNVAKWVWIWSMPVIVDKTVDALWWDLNDVDKQNLKTFITDWFFTYLWASGKKAKLNQDIKQWFTWENKAPIIKPETISKITDWAKDIYKWFKEKATLVKEKIPWLPKVDLTKTRNVVAERILDSDWKLNKKYRDGIENATWESWPEFALRNNLVWKSVEQTANNAWKFKIQKIKEKTSEVKKFWTTETPSVAKNMAKTMVETILKDIKKSYKLKTNAQALKKLKAEHPEFYEVYKLSKEISKSKNIDYTKLEQLKELYDYFNPEKLKFDIKGKPENTFANEVVAQKRAKLQKLIETRWNELWIDIKQINKEIRAAYQLEKWLHQAVWRKAKLNIFWLWDMETAIISAILWWAPWVLWALVVKKWVTSESFKGSIAKKLYTKDKVNETINTVNNLVKPNTTHKSRVDRIMNIGNNTTTKPKVVKKTTIKPKNKKQPTKLPPKAKNKLPDLPPETPPTAPVAKLKPKKIVKKTNAISKYKSRKSIEAVIEKTPLSKEATALSKLWKNLKSKTAKNANTTNVPRSISNTWNKKTTWKSSSKSTVDSVVSNDKARKVTPKKIGATKPPKKVTKPKVIKKTKTPTATSKAVTESQKAVAESKRLWLIADRVTKGKPLSKAVKESQKAITEARKLTKKVKQINSKAWFIEPWTIYDDIAKLGKVINPKDAKVITKWILSKINVAKWKVTQATKIINDYIKKYWAKLKDKLWELFDDLADKVWARIKLLGWEWSLKAPVTNLQRAKNMTKAWNKADDIWKKTGWEKWTDGKWRFEISDSKAVIKPKLVEDVKVLWDILDHPELYKHYPDLKNVKIKYWKLDKWTVWLFEPELNTITISNDIWVKLKDLTKTQLSKVKNIKEVSSVNWDKLLKWDFAMETSKKWLFLNKSQKSALLHEIQHKIQQVEWFAKWWSFKKWPDIYKRLAWEVEARNVQTRLIKPTKIRPWLTEDVPRTKQITK